MKRPLFFFCGIALIVITILYKKPVFGLDDLFFGILGAVYILIGIL